MNEMEEFLNFGAVVKIRPCYDDEVYKFIKLMRSIGFLNEYVNCFEKICSDKERNEFSEDVFWHYVETNNGNKNDTCIEFQWGKGFTWGDREQYIDYDAEMKILNVDELIRACNKDDLFKMNYKYTNFKDELCDKESASELDHFLDFYEWSITKYPDGKYNIKDEQCNTFDFEENTTLDEVINRVYFRMFDYFTDEEDIEGFIEEGGFEYIKDKYNSYMEIGEKLKLLDGEKRKQYVEWFQEVIQENKEKGTIEIDKDI